MQALRISTDANVSRIDLVEGGRKISDGLRAEIGCQFFDVVSLPDGNGGRIDMWLDDEGMYGVGVNPAASFVARRLAPAVQPFFFGNAPTTVSTSWPRLQKRPRGILLQSRLCSSTSRHSATSPSSSTRRYCRRS